MKPIYWTAETRIKPGKWNKTDLLANNSNEKRSRNIEHDKCCEAANSSSTIGTDENIIVRGRHSNWHQEERKPIKQLVELPLGIFDYAHLSYQREGEQ